MVLEDVSSQDEEPPSSLLPHEIVVGLKGIVSKICLNLTILSPIIGKDEGLKSYFSKILQ